MKRSCLLQKKKKKSFGTPPILKLCACLWFFAEGGYQKRVARDYKVGMAQSSFCISQVLDALEQHLCKKWITYPTEQMSRGSLANQTSECFLVPLLILSYQLAHIWTVHLLKSIWTDLVLLPSLFGVSNLWQLLIAHISSDLCKPTVQIMG